MEEMTESISMHKKAPAKQPDAIYPLVKNLLCIDFDSSASGTKTANRSNKLFKNSFNSYVTAIPAPTPVPKIALIICKNQTHYLKSFTFLNSTEQIIYLLLKN